MKLTKSHKIYLSILGVGVCALVLDRSLGTSAPVGGPPSIAGRVQSPGNEPFRTEGGARAAAVSDSDKSISARLARLQFVAGSSGVLRDAFVPTSAWIGSDQREQPDRNAAAERVLKFQNSHILKGIVESNGGGQALVDNKLILVGQSIDGFHLTSVGQMRAIFSDGNIRAVLRLDYLTSTDQQPLHSQ